MKVIGWNPGNFLKTFLLYDKTTMKASDKCNIRIKLNCAPIKDLLSLCRSLSNGSCQNVSQYRYIHTFLQNFFKKPNQRQGQWTLRFSSFEIAKFTNFVLRFYPSIYVLFVIFLSYPFPVT